MIWLIFKQFIKLHQCGRRPCVCVECVCVHALCTSSNGILITIFLIYDNIFYRETHLKSIFVVCQRTFSIISSIFNFKTSFEHNVVLICFRIFIVRVQQQQWWAIVLATMVQVTICFIMCMHRDTR